ncbi:MAG: hypothetical protein R3E54_03445 [Halioglobus sp.]
MSMIVDVATYLASPPEVIERQLRTPRLLIFVASPLVRFVPCGGASLPQAWESKTYWVSLRLFGCIPLGRQAIVISFPESPLAFSMRDSGQSRLIRTWDHMITLEASGAGTVYRDRVTISAGVFTVFVWAFAQVFYRHRQRRWRQLVASGFDYGAT